MRRLLLVVGLLAACGTSSIRARWTHVEDAARIDRVELYVSIQHDARVGVMFRSFETRMLARLEACHVRTTIIHGRPEGDALQSTAPRLTVAPSEGTYTNVSVVDQHGATVDERRTTKLDASVRAELFDPRAGKVTWRSIIDIQTSSTPDTGDGKAFADLVLTQLTAAGVITCGG